MRATYSCPCGKYTVVRNVCSNGAFGTAVNGVILFCGEISSKFVVDRANVRDDDFVMPFGATFQEQKTFFNHFHL